MACVLVYDHHHFLKAHGNYRTSYTNVNGPPNEVTDDSRKPSEVTRGSQPVFIQHPDGTVVEGVPPEYKDPTPPRSPPAAMMWWDNSMSVEFDFIYSRHERLFVALLLMQFVVEFIFNVMYIFHAHYSVREVAMVYHSLSEHTLWIIFWTLFVSEVIYCAVYYAVAVAAVWLTRPKLFRWFAHVALLGILGEVILAYMNKFNLLIFFLRLMAYIYAKFLRNLLLSIYLIPDITTA